MKLKPIQVIKLEKLDVAFIIDIRDFKNVSDFTDDGIVEKGRMHCKLSNVSKLEDLASRWNELLEGEVEYHKTYTLTTPPPTL